jgi:BASS family bile acid:Na+ symporter
MPGNTAPRGLERHFPLIAAGLSALALAWPGLFAWGGAFISPALGLIMFGMGMTLDWQDFRRAFARWPSLILGLGLQYSVMPLVAVALGFGLGLPREALIGLVLVGASPGGTASNVLAYLARADVALSVLLTLCSTVLAPLATPALAELILGQRVDIDVFGMMRSVFWIVVFPLLDGLVLRRILRHRLAPVQRFLPSLSILVISLVIACVVALNRAAILDFPALVLLAVTAHNLLGLGLGYGLTRLFRRSETEARTIAIEVGVQNSGLAVALAIKHFSAAAALPGALFSLWQNMSGALLARFWSGRGAAE